MKNTWLLSLILVAIGAFVFGLNLNNDAAPVDDIGEQPPTAQKGPQSHNTSTIATKNKFSAEETVQPEWQTCVSQTKGYTVDYPNGWVMLSRHVRKGDTWPRFAYRLGVCDTNSLIFVLSDTITTQPHQDGEAQIYEELAGPDTYMTLRIRSLHGSPNGDIEENTRVMRSKDAQGDAPTAQLNYVGMGGSIQVYGVDVDSDILFKILGSIQSI